MHAVQDELQERCEKQQLMLQQATERIMAQERTISDHKALIEKQAAQLAAAQSEASSTSSSTMQHSTAALASLAGSDPAMLHAVSTQLVSVLKEALAEVGMQAGPVATALQDSIVQHITRTLSSCWRDLRAHASNLAQSTPSDKPMTAITVSCC